MALTLLQDSAYDTVSDPRANQREIVSLSGAYQKEIIHSHGFIRAKSSALLAPKLQSSSFTQLLWSLWPVEPLAQDNKIYLPQRVRQQESETWGNATQHTGIIDGVPLLSRKKNLDDKAKEEEHVPGQISIYCEKYQGRGTRPSHNIWPRISSMNKKIQSSMRINTSVQTPTFSPSPLSVLRQPHTRRWHRCLKERSPSAPSKNHKIHAEATRPYLRLNSRARKRRHQPYKCHSPVSSSNLAQDMFDF